MKIRLDLNGAQLDALTEALYDGMGRDTEAAKAAHGAVLALDGETSIGDDTAAVLAEYELSDVYAFASNAARLGRIILSLDDRS